MYSFANKFTFGAFVVVLSLCKVYYICLIIFSRNALSLSVPPSESFLIPSTENPLSVGDILNISCSTDSSNPKASLVFSGVTDFQLSDDVLSAGIYHGQKVTKSLSVKVGKEHNGIDVRCSVSYLKNNVEGLQKTFLLNVTCK